MDNTSAPDAVEIVSRNMSRYLWLCGLYHPFSQIDTHEPKTSKPVSSFKRRFGYTVAVLTSLLAILDLADYMTYYSRDLATWDFFVLVRFVKVASTTAQIPLIMLILFLSRRKVFYLERITRIGVPIITENTVARLQKRFSRFAALWLAFWFIIYCIGATGHYWPSISSLQALNTPVKFLGGTVRNYFSILFSVVSYGIFINASIASQMFTLLLVIHLAAGFENIYKNINSKITLVLKGEYKAASAATVLEVELRSLQLLQNLVRNFNDAFGFMILVHCIRDMISVVGIIALFLQVFEKQDIDESDADYAQRLDVRTRQTYWDWSITSITLANTALRVRKIVRSLQRHRVESQCTQLQEECETALSDINEETGAISAGGFFYVNLDYVGAVMGMCVTYGILVYQMRDQKVAAADNVKLSHLQRQTALLQTFVQNQSQLLLSLIRNNT
ncbi:hypothetical protein RvY_12186 [Ramazzottius varieornatus]|uniref:Gustatory receptor n=1 Tax=Ramazzottius varieornatus TaxID=947166 RepID=A0A1D1VIQ4_RAMVA|nr:hypothetical protein RvY_12186 [Ramazzottius varieornatus]